MSTHKTYCLSLFLLTLSCNNNPYKQSDESIKNKTTNKKTMEQEELQNFATKYAAAWCSQQPETVASFFDSTGSLKVNDALPAIGRTEITKVAEGFMIAFPDMKVSMDSLVTNSKQTEFHWTLTGKNTGPNGTGNSVHISGVELWELNDKGLIQKSIGSFDAKEYHRQLEQGIKN